MSWMEPNILIIDDDKEYTKVVQSYFGNRQFKDVLTYHNVMDCLNTHDKRPDVIFVNYKMNDIEGVRAARMLKRKWSRARVVVMKSSVKAKKRVNKKKFGIDSIIDVSADMNEFMNEVNYHKTNKITKIVLQCSFFLLSIVGIIFFIL